MATLSKDAQNSRNILSRSLVVMARKAKDTVRADVQRLVASVQVSNSALDSTGDSAEVDRLVDAILNGSQNSADCNSSRLRSVSEYFTTRKSVHAGVAIDILMEPIEHATNGCLGRSTSIFLAKSSLDEAEKQKHMDKPSS